MLNLYIVGNGEITEIDPKDAMDADVDGENSVLVIAESVTAAVKAASAYDRGEIGIDNHVIDGITVAAVQQSA